MPSAAFTANHANPAKTSKPNSNNRVSLPREKLEPPETGKGLFGRFLERVRQWLRSLRDWASKWLRKFFQSHLKTGADNSSGYGWIFTLQILLELLAVAA